MMSEQYIQNNPIRVAVDLGGTYVRAQRFNGGLPEKAPIRLCCPSQGSEEEVLDAIIGLIASCVTTKTEGIGIAVPSIVDTHEGIVYDVCNIPSWKEVHLKEIIERRFGIETRVDNDVNCFALGEKYYGEGREFHNFVGINLGTGLGAGIIINDKIYRGANDTAGELGGVPYLGSDYEHYTSSLFLKGQSTLSGLELAQKAQQGDLEAMGIFHEFGHHVGKLLQTTILTYDPEAVIIGGGLANAAQWFKSAMTESLNEGFYYPKVASRLKVIFTHLKDANLKGAVSLF